MKYPIGIQDFQFIREYGYQYVDKTDLIYKLISGFKYVFLSRPRRFGKSLLLSTLKYYFEGRRDLFTGLAIENLEKDWNSHPVFHITLANVNSSEPGSLQDELKRQFEQWEKFYGIEEYKGALSSKFANLIMTAFNRTGQRVVVLIDEYDNPLINTLNQEKKEIHQANRELLKAIYSNLKDLDPYIRFGMLTGVSRFSKMSIFSGLNNLYDISLDKDYAAICGITESEIKDCLWSGIEDFAHENEMSPQIALDLLKKYYDGYHFSKASPDIYNPFSLFNALTKKEIGSYWFSTGTPTFLIDRLKTTQKSLSEIFNESADYQQLASMDASFSSLVSLLYQTGYLTIKGYDKEKELYQLGIPNLEVEKSLFSTSLAEFIGKEEINTSKDTSRIKKSLIDGDINLFMHQLQIFIGTIPYSIIPIVSEKYFQNIMYLLFSVMGLEVVVEHEHSFGRSDVVITTDNYVCIFELKLDASPEEALRQIEEKQYYLPFISSGKEIILIGASFSSHTRSLSSWLTKTNPHCCV